MEIDRRAFVSSLGGAAGKPFGVSFARIHLGRGEYAQALIQLNSLGNPESSPDTNLLFAAAYRCLGRPDKSAEHLASYIAAYGGDVDDRRWVLARSFFASVTKRCVN